MDYYPSRAGELLSVITIERQTVTLTGGGGTQYRARYLAAEDGLTVEPLRPADILAVIHPNPIGKSVVVEHATKGFRDSYQYNLIFDVV